MTAHSDAYAGTEQTVSGHVAGLASRSTSAVTSSAYSDANVTASAPPKE